jgi:hypothetical protein
MRARADLAWIAEEWNRLRARFFLDAEEPARVPPVAEDLTFYGMPPGSPLLGCIEYDEDDDVCAVGISPDIYPSRTLARDLLLHEMTHARRPDLGGRHGSGCGSAASHSAGWRKEMVRLALLGAPLL